MVRQAYQPPVQSCCLFPWFIVNGAMNSKLPEDSVMPLMAEANDVPPFTDLWIESAEFSRNRTSLALLASPRVSTAV